MDTGFFCQSCLTTKNLLLYSKSDNKYEIMFQTCFNIKVGFGNDKLKWICKECINNLSKALEFKTQVEKTQNYLEEYFNESFQFCDVKKGRSSGNVITERFQYPLDSNNESFDNFLSSFKIKCETVEDKILSVKVKKKKQKSGRKSKLNNTLDIRKNRYRIANVLDGEKTSNYKADCDLCLQSFVDECSLTVHKYNSHGVKANVPKFAVLLSCSYCKSVFARLDELNEHLVVDHDCSKEKVICDTLNFVSCRICGFYFHDYSVRSYHLQNTHKLKEIPANMLKQCSDCDKMFKNVYSQAVHMYNTHKIRAILPNGGVYLNCLQCKLDFRKIFTYKRHMKEFHRNNNGISAKIFWCKFCGCYFANKTDWLNHYVTHGIVSRLHRALPKEAGYKCKKCSERFLLTSARKKHMENVHNFKETLPCEVCGQLLSSKLALNKHLKIHSNEITAICDHCGYGVRDKFDLIAHFPKHSDKKQFKCHICMKEFKVYGTLRQHKKVHFEKQFCCTVCGLRFTHRANMKSHMIRNHKETCITDFSFNSKSLLG